MYLLTQCASCAAPLSLDAPKCVRCKTRYCDASCQRDHWRRHKKDCEAMGREGITAEVRHAQEEALNAVRRVRTVDHQNALRLGLTCYVCHETTSNYEEDLARACSCAGKTGCAHLTCLTELARKATPVGATTDDGWARWSTCRLCGQEYHGAFRCALAWQCWWNYSVADKRPKDDVYLYRAMLELGIGLVAASRYEDAFAVLETLCQTIDDERTNLGPRLSCKALMHLAKACNKLGWECDILRINESEALSYGLLPGKHRLSGLTMLRALFVSTSSAFGENDELTLRCALELAVCMLDQNLALEAMRVLGKARRAAMRTLGENHVMVYEFLWRCAQATYMIHFFGGNNHRGQLIASVEGHVRALVWTINTLGAKHPMTFEIRASLKLCFDEQLDWTLGDFPQRIFEDLAEILRPREQKFDAKLAPVRH